MPGFARALVVGFIVVSTKKKLVDRLLYGFRRCLQNAEFELHRQDIAELYGKSSFIFLEVISRQHNRKLRLMKILRQPLIAMKFQV